jgi:hypothetical protein
MKSSVLISKREVIELITLEMNKELQGLSEGFNEDLKLDHLEWTIEGIVVHYVHNNNKK